MQVVAAGALRGYKDTVVPLLLAASAIGEPVSPAAGCSPFRSAMAPSGLWWGLALGLAVVAVLLTLRLHLLAGPSAT